MAEIYCKICKEASLSKTAHPDYLQCDSCGVVFQTTNIKNIIDYYADQALIPDCSRQIGSYRQYLALIKRHVERPTALIDIGAADGFFLKTAEKCFPGISIHACEKSETAIQALAKVGIRSVALNAIKDISGPKVVTMLQVLEHIGEPGEFISACALETGDWLVVTSPATDSPYYSRHGLGWQSFSPSHHLNLFNRNSLNKLLTDYGFEMIAYEHCYSGNLAHNIPTAVLKYVYQISLWISRVLRHGWSLMPRYHGKNSFICIARKK